MVRKKGIVLVKLLHTQVNTQANTQANTLSNTQANTLSNTQANTSIIYSI
jgi:hypothetical protein